MLPLKVYLSELEIAFDSGGGMTSYYLDLVTGDVLSISDEDRDLLKRIYRSYYDERSQIVDWETAFEKEHIPDWQREPLNNADLIEADFGSRFLAIPSEGSNVGYHDMEAFIVTVRNQHLQERLEGAISGRGAFRRFKDVLLDYPTERERWFQFNRERLHKRMLDWLEEQGISPT